MNFKELKAGYPIYMLERQGMKFETGKVINVSIPHIDNKIGGATNLVVDIEAEFGGNRATYCMLADGDCAYPNGCVLSTNREHIIQEVNATKSQCESALAQIDMQRETLERCKALLAELDPVQREKQANEARFVSIEKSIEKIANMLEKVVN